MDRLGNLSDNLILNYYQQLAEISHQISDEKKFYQAIDEELKPLSTEGEIQFVAAEATGGQVEILFPYSFQSHEEETLSELLMRSVAHTGMLTLEDKEIGSIVKKNASTSLPTLWLSTQIKVEHASNRYVSICCYQSNNLKIDDLRNLLRFTAYQIKGFLVKPVTNFYLRQQNARLDALFQNSNHLVWTVNRKMELTTYNTNFEQFLIDFYKTNNSPDELMGLVKTEHYRKFWEPKYALILSGQKTHFELSLASKKRDIWLEVFLSPVYAESGEIVEISGIAHDVTEIKKSAQKLKESEEKFRNIFESFQDIYFRCSFKGNINMLSPSVTELTGYDKNEILGKDITNYYLYTSKTKDLIRQLIRKKVVRNFEASVVTKSGEIITCICNVRLIHDEAGKPTEIEGVARDITSLKKVNRELVKQKEIAEHSLKVKEKFLANMSHEIRTPMNGIIGVIDLLSTTGLDNLQSRYVSTIRKSSETLLAILNDVLDLSKIEAGKMKLKLRPVNLKTTLDKLYALFVQRARDNHIDLGYTIQNEIPNLLADETRLLQILSNLTSNAIKFTPENGKIDISITSVGTESQSELTLLVKVKDTGIGISDENRKRLFKSFSQVDESSTKVYSGTGLGLAISKQLAELMGGEIGVESKLGEGSTFWFTFLANKTDQEVFEGKQQEEEQFELESNFKKLFELSPKILVVDDNGVNRMVAGEILDKAGCHVDLCEDGFNAIEMIRDNTYDLVFMDIQMPEMDGIETNEKLRKEISAPIPPIIAMTAYSMKEDRQKFLDAGFEDYIPKPIKANDLLHKVLSWLNIADEGNTGRSMEEELNDKHQILNFNVLGQLEKYGGKKMVQEALEEFEQETRDILRSLNTLDRYKELEGIKRAFHTLKGNAGTLGIEELAKVATQADLELKNNNLTNLASYIHEINVSFDNFKSVFHQKFKEKFNGRN